MCKTLSPVATVCMGKPDISKKGLTLHPAGAYCIPTVNIILQWQTEKAAEARRTAGSVLEDRKRKGFIRSIPAGFR